MTEDGVRASVIIPCFRAEDVLDDCLVALRRQSTDLPHEIIVVDNDESEASCRAAREASAAEPQRIRVVKETTPGAYAARNRGIAEARGAVLVFTDADCRPDSDWLEGLLEAVARPGILAAGSEILAASQAGVVARYASEAGILSQRHTLAHERGPFLQTASLAVRADRARALGGFDASLPTGGDADFCWRLAAAHPAEELLLISGGIVRHHHRETVGGLYRQFRRYGQGDVIFARRHGPRPLRELARLGLDAARVVLSPLIALLALPVALIRRDPLPLAAPFLRAVRVVGRRAGRLRARLRPDHLHRA